MEVSCECLMSDDCRVSERLKDFNGDISMNTIIYYQTHLSRV